MITPSSILHRSGIALASLIYASAITSLVAQNEPAADTAVAVTPGETAPELTEAADLAIERGLQYLVATQNPNGSWTSKAGNYEIACTMACMA